MDEEWGKLSGSLSWCVGPEEKVWTEPPVQSPESTGSQDLDSALCPYHRKHLGLRACGSLGHSGCLGASCVAWPHSAQI